MCLTFLAMTRLTLNVSDSSAPAGLYWVRSATAFKRGDLVALREPLKRLVGVPGDLVTNNQMGTFVNGKLIPNSAVPEGSPYSPCPFGRRRLAEDQYWALGDNPLSWDSRYVCEIPMVLVRASVAPVWTKKVVPYANPK
jgi:type IV secretory pathway protease TraF